MHACVCVCVCLCVCVFVCVEGGGVFVEAVENQQEQPGSGQLTELSAASAGLQLSSVNDLHSSSAGVLSKTSQHGL